MAVTGSFKPFVLGFASCGALALALAAGPRLWNEPPGEPAPAAISPPEGTDEVKPKGECDGDDDDSDCCASKVVEIKDLPEAVTRALREVADDAVPESATVLEVDGVTVYTVVALAEAAKRMVFTVSGAGTVFQQDESIGVSDLPLEFTKLLEARLPGAKIESAGQVLVAGYYAAVTVAGKTYTVVLNADEGLIIEPMDDADDEIDDCDGKEEKDGRANAEGKAPGF